VEIIHRPRRLRRHSAIRNLVSDITINSNSLVLPIFIKEGITEKKEISGMKNVFQHTEDSALSLIREAVDHGIGGVMIFGIPDTRDEFGSEALKDTGILSKSIKAIKNEFENEIVVMADLCLDEFTSHGHCGLLADNGLVDNDQTLVAYKKMAEVLAAAGADVLGTSGMMDGQVGAIREALDKQSFQDVSILAYSAKFASNFYGPFRGAVESQLEGDRKTYQQDFRNIKESKREIILDLQEGADIVMIKPALAYLDIIQSASQISNVPIAAYIVSGEMAMLESSAQLGHIDRKGGILEIVTSVRRAGANIVLTYWALEIAKWLREK
jgi:porphobilinogen synthase